MSSKGRIRRWFKELWLELEARSAGRRALGHDNDFFTATRGITGVIGAPRSDAYDLLQKDQGAYVRSMKREPQLPPSLFVSERDRVRHGEAIPLAERCLEDVGTKSDLDVGDWDIKKLNK